MGVGHVAVKVHEQTRRIAAQQFLCAKSAVPPLFSIKLTGIDKNKFRFLLWTQGYVHKS